MFLVIPELGVISNTFTPVFNQDFKYDGNSLRADVLTLLTFACDHPFSTYAKYSEKLTSLTP